MHALDFVLPGDPATHTGGYIYDSRIVRGLSALGWQTRVHALDASFPKPTGTALREARAVFAALPAGRVVVVDGLALGGMPALVEAEAGRLQLVGLVHHPLAAETGLDEPQARTLFEAERRALAATTGVIVTSQATARALDAYGVPQDQIGVVAPGTDRRNPARGSGGGVPTLLCVGAVTPRKGHALLLDALFDVRDRPWQLSCVGSLLRSPATAAALRRQVTKLGLDERVSLCGEVDPEALVDHYDTADVFVLPSYLEGYGMALAEALAWGLPVVSTRAGAIPDTIPSAAGLLVPPGDRRALATALAAVLDDARLRQHFADSARRAGMQLPSWDEATGRFAHELARLTAA